jgi:hypothetical protein
MHQCTAGIGILFRDEFHQDNQKLNAGHLPSFDLDTFLNENNLFSKQIWYNSRNKSQFLARFDHFLRTK